MNRIAAAVVMTAFAATAAFGQTTSTETQKEKKQHELACIAGTATGLVLGAAVGGLFGGGVGKTLMEVAGGGGGAFVGHNLACKKNS